MGLLSLGACNAVLGIDTPKGPTPAADGGDGGCGDACAVTCAQGTVRCGETCVVADSDPRNCGTCGHDCLTGACREGVCQSAVLADDLNGVRSMATDGVDLYYVANAATGDRLGRVSRRGPPCQGIDARCAVVVPEDIFVNDAGTRSIPDELAVNGSHLYATFPSLGVGRFDKVGTWTPFVLLGDEKVVMRMIANEAALFALVRGTRRWFDRYDTGGDAVRPRATSSQEGVVEASSLVLDTEGQYGYAGVTESTAPVTLGVHRVPLGGTNSCTDNECLMVASPGVRGLTFGGSALYVTLGSTASSVLVDVVRYPPTGRCSSPPCAQTIVQSIAHGEWPMPMVVDERHLYWVEHEGTREYVARLPLGETCLVPRAPGAICGEAFLGPYDRVQALIQDHDALYAVVRVSNGSMQIVQRTK